MMTTIMRDLLVFTSALLSTFISKNSIINCIVILIIITNINQIKQKNMQFTTILIQSSIYLCRFILFALILFSRFLSNKKWTRCWLSRVNFSKKRQFCLKRIFITQNNERLFLLKILSIEMFLEYLFMTKIANLCQTFDETCLKN